MKRKLILAPLYLLVIVFFCHDLTSPLFGTPNVLAWEAGTGYGIGRYGETNVPADLTNAVEIAAGGFHSLALRQDGTVVAWGDNNFGQTNVPAGLSNVIAVAAGYYHSIALQADGTITIWGDNEFGQTNVPAGLSNVVAISGSYDVTMALTAGGTVFAWGNNGYGQTNIPPGLSNVVAISAGFYDSMALKRDGTVVAWGSGPFPASVTNVPIDLTNAVAIDCSMSISVEHSLALRSDGTVSSWGYTQAAVPSGLTNVAAVAAGGVAYGGPESYDLALLCNGTLVGWGGTTNLPAGQSNIVAIASGEAHQLALLGSGPPVINAPIISPSMTGPNFCLQIETQCGRVYSLEFKNTLNDSCWTPLPLVAGTGGIAALRDFSPTNSQRFYRVRRW